MKIAICVHDADEREMYHQLLVGLLEAGGGVFNIALYGKEQELLFDVELMKEPFDIIYLEIDILYIDGIQVAQKLRAEEFEGQIIFISASRDYLLEAFDVKAFNYIIKDELVEERFKKIFQSVSHVIKERDEKYIVFASNGEVLTIPINSIYYFESVRKILTVHHEKGSFEFYSTLTKMKERLSDRGFIRIHRSFLVAQMYIYKVTAHEVILRNGMSLPVGRTYYKALKEEMGKSIA